MIVLHTKHDIYLGNEQPPIESIHWGDLRDTWEVYAKCDNRCVPQAINTSHLYIKLMTASHMIAL
jgi:hypothetical protein